MKRIIVLGAFLLMGSVFVLGISPYLKVAELTGDIGAAAEKVETVLGENGYEVIGRYKPGGNSNFSVVVFTSDKIKTFCLNAKGRGMLAAAMKVGLEKRGGVINVSILNPEYLFYAYFRDQMDNSSFKFSAKDLKKYHYMMGMPHFDDPVKLAEFENFQQGVAKIQKNLTARKGNTVKVYEIIDEKNRTAVFGVGLLDKEEGEAHFLPIIGESHVAAMPYELAGRR
ncbi:MAG: hypothetical protein KAR19_13945 [Bacteroidales bacterium]|nr:hypothetical protein [Bacteroidales bacterium]